MYENIAEIEVISDKTELKLFLIYSYIVYIYLLNILLLNYQTGFSTSTYKSNINILINSYNCKILHIKNEKPKKKRQIVSLSVFIIF